jgi:hypothetical protein
MGRNDIFVADCSDGILDLVILFANFEAAGYRYILNVSEL